MNEEHLKTRYGEVVSTADELPPQRTVVLLHGLGGDRVQALSQVDLGPEDKIRRVALEMRGHGLNPTVGPPGSLNLPTFAEEVAEVLEHEREEGMESCVLAGVSMGAAITLEVALRHPDLLKAIVLIRPAWAGTQSPVSSRIFTTVGQILREHGPDGRTLFAESHEYQALRRTSPVVAASLMKQFDRDQARARASVLEEIPNSQVPTLAELEQVELPALVVSAPDDPVHAFDYGLALSKALPRAQFDVLPRKQLKPSDHEVVLRATVSAFVREQLANR